jgi:enoyl-CoA hydratase
VASATFASDEAAWKASERSLELVLASDDLAEGVAAFAQKREPFWTGR